MFKIKSERGKGEREGRESSVSDACESPDGKSTQGTPTHQNAAGHLGRDNVSVTAVTLYLQ